MHHGDIFAGMTEIYDEYRTRRITTLDLISTTIFTKAAYTHSSPGVSVTNGTGLREHRNARHDNTRV